MQILKSERINLLARSHSYFPAAFRWRGRRFDIIAVQKCWMVRRPVVRRMFRVRCAAGSFLLEQSVADDTWQVSRWPWALWLARPVAAGPSARFPLPRGQRRPARPLSLGVAAAGRGTVGQPMIKRAMGGPKMAAATPSEPSTAKIIAPAAQSLAVRASS